MGAEVNYLYHRQSGDWNCLSLKSGVYSKFGAKMMRSDDTWGLKRNLFSQPMGQVYRITRPRIRYVQLLPLAAPKHISFAGENGLIRNCVLGGERKKKKKGRYTCVLQRSSMIFQCYDKGKAYIYGIKHCSEFQF